MPFIHKKTFYRLTYLNFEGRSAHGRSSDRTNNDRLFCNPNTGYPQQAANSVVAGHLLRKLVEKVM